MTLTGKIIEIGDLKHLRGVEMGIWPSGVVILVTREQLEVLKENPLYCKVKIELVKK